MSNTRYQKVNLICCLTFLSCSKFQSISQTQKKKEKTWKTKVGQIDGQTNRQTDADESYSPHPVKPL